MDKPIAFRLTVQDQQKVPNSTAQELYHGMVGSLLYLASWTHPDVAFAFSELSHFVSILANHTLKQPNMCLETSRRLLVLGFKLSTAARRPPKCLPTLCGVTLTRTGPGLAALRLTLVTVGHRDGLLRAFKLCSRSMVLPSHGAPT